LAAEEDDDMSLEEVEIVCRGVAICAFDPSTVAASMEGIEFLAFNAGQEIDVICKDESGWWEGVISGDGELGVFPGSHIKVLEEFAFDSKDGAAADGNEPAAAAADSDSHNKDDDADVGASAGADGAAGSGGGDIVMSAGSAPAAAAADDSSAASGPNFAQLEPHINEFRHLLNKALPDDIESLLSLTQLLEDAVASTETALIEKKTLLEQMRS
jgi:Variant SH3 domain